MAIPAWFLQMSLTVCNSIFYMYDTAVFWWNRLSVTVETLFLPRCYFFLKDSVYPYEFMLGSSWSKGAATPYLMYSADNRVFFPLLPNKSFSDMMTYPKSPIPILSLELIKNDGTPMYDLTDFIEPMRFIFINDNEAVPTLGHIISAWQLHKRVVLDSSTVQAQYIDGSGNVIKDDIRSEKSLFVDEEGDAVDEEVDEIMAELQAELKAEDEVKALPKVVSESPKDPSKALSVSRSTKS
jgi:hypothetical protein